MFFLWCTFFDSFFLSSLRSHDCSLGSVLQLVVRDSLAGWHGWVPCLLQIGVASDYVPRRFAVWLEVFSALAYLCCRVLEHSVLSWRGCCSHSTSLGAGRSGTNACASSLEHETTIDRAYEQKGAVHTSSNDSKAAHVQVACNDLFVSKGYTDS